MAEAPREGTVRQILREELDRFVEDIFAPSCKRNDDDHTEIKQKQDHTNSNVTKLQEFKARVEGALYATKAGWGIAVALIGLAAAVYFGR
jgi:hypothetical protein